MSLLSPIKIDTGKRIISTVPVIFTYLDPITKVTLARKASNLFISEDELKATGEWARFAVDTNVPSEAQFLKFIGMQSLIKTCADNAEDIKDRLLNIILTISPNSKMERLDIMKMDFMKLKNRFMDFLKVDQLLKSIDEYNSNQKLKPFRRDFDVFVTDRNIYTHGQLHFLRPDYDFAIEYIHNQTREKAYARITEEILINYNSFYKEILKLIEAFHRTRNYKSI